MTTSRQVDALVTMQLTADRQATKTRPELLLRKWSRMAASSFAFFRGAAPIFDAVSSAGLPGDSGAVVGDAHLENFGTFATQGGVAFQVNDFDCYRVGKYAGDLLRLCTSVMLARPQLGVDGIAVQNLAEAALEGHQLGLGAGSIAMPEPLRLLTASVTALRQTEWLKKRLEREDRLLRDGDKLRPAPLVLVRAVPKAVARYLAWLPESERASVKHLEVLDVVRRVAGTGSLGVERLLVLCRAGREQVLLELKQMHCGAAAVVAMMRKALPAAPALLGHTSLGRVDLMVRRYAPGEEKLEATRLQSMPKEVVVPYLGRLLGQVHRRAAAPVKIKLLSQRERQWVLTRARELAGLHEEAFLIFCSRVKAL